MSAITWPQSAFPNPNTAYAFDTDTDVQRTPFTSGRARQRQRSTQELRLVRISWDLNDIQLAMFQSYIHNTLAGGLEYFNIDLALGDAIANYEARFVVGQDGKCYSSSNSGVLNWRVSALLEVEQLTDMLSAEELELAILLYPDVEAFITDSDEFHTLVHETLYGELA